MSVSVKQGRIPEFKHFTKDYNQEKVHQHDIIKMVEKADIAQTVISSIKHLHEPEEES